MARGHRRRLDWIEQGLRGAGRLETEDTAAGVYIELSGDYAEDRLLSAMAVQRGATIALGSVGEYALVATFEATGDIETAVPLDAVDGGPGVFVGGTYKPAAKKVHPAAVPLPVDAQERIDRARLEPRLRDPATIGHEFTPETLAKLRVGGDDLLTMEEEREMRAMLARHGRAFAFADTEIGCVDPMVVPPLVLFTVPHVPWKLRPLPVPRAHYDQLVALLRRRLATRVLEPSSGPYACRWFTVPKKDNKLRFIQDLQPANQVVIRHSGVAPLIEDYIDEFAARSVYSILDLFSGYDQFQLEVASRDLTALQTPLGLLRMAVTPQGGTTSVGHVVNAVNEIFKDFIPQKMRPFVDDIPVKGARTEEKDETEVRPGVRRFVADHIADVDAILGRGEEVGLTFSGEKGAFGLRRIPLVGYVCDEHGKLPDPKKTDAIERMSACRSRSDVRRFLGAVGYFRVFIPQFAARAEPLVNLLRGKTVWDWTPECEMAMDELKQALLAAPILRPLVYGDGGGVIFLTVDGGPAAVGWVLNQEDSDGRRWPAKFGARTLTEVQRRYGQTKKELFAVRTALREERRYVLGVHVVIETDCRALLGMTVNGTTIDLASQRWIADIKEYDTEVVHIKGTDNAIADWLSRAEYGDGSDAASVDPGGSASGSGTEAMAFLARCGSTRTGPGGACTGNDGCMANAEGPRHDQKLSDSEADVADTGGALVFVPELYQEPERSLGLYLREVQRGKQVSAPSFLRKRAMDYFLHEGLLWKRPRPGEASPRRVVGTTAERRRVLEGLHDEHFAGHRGVERTYQRAKELYVWQGMRRDVAKFVESCEVCQAYSRKRHRDAIHPTYPRALLYTWYLDLMVMPRARGYRYLVLAREELTGFVEGRALRSNHTVGVCRFVLEEIIARYGCFERLRADRGELNSREAREFFERLGVWVVLTTAYNPEANGKIERGHQAIVDALAKAADGKVRDWPVLLPYALWADRSTAHRSTGFPPATLMFGQRMRFPVEDNVRTWTALPWRDNLPREELLALRVRQLQRREEDIEAALATMTRERDKMAAAACGWDSRPRPLELGDWVVVRQETLEHHHRAERKFTRRWAGPYVVSTADPTTSTYGLRELDGTLIKHRYPGKRVKLFRRRDAGSFELPSADEDESEEEASVDGGERRRHGEDVGI